MYQNRRGHLIIMNIDYVPDQQNFASAASAHINLPNQLAANKSAYGIGEVIFHNIADKAEIPIAFSSHSNNKYLSVGIIYSH